MLQLAGEIADGVIMMTGISPAALDYGLSHIERGARRAGRQLADLDIAVGAYCHITDDWRTIKRLAQPYAALYALRYRGTDRDFGIDIPADFGISSLYPDLLHAEDWDAAIAATNWVPDSVLEAFCEEWVLMGTGEQVAARIRQLEAYGVRHLYIRHFFTYDLPLDVCAALATQVISRFR
jgi:5,10-methylenetetrahydromethanopterin reductase